MIIIIISTFTCVGKAQNNFYKKRYYGDEAERFCLEKIDFFRLSCTNFTGSYKRFISIMAKRAERLNIYVDIGKYHVN